MKKLALGKGLDALIGPESKISGRSAEVMIVPLSRIERSEYQPRKKFEPKALQDLKQSIKEKGVIQPILLRKSGAGFQLIAGERRVRAAIELGLKEIPALVKEIDRGEDILEISLIENIQREDLNPLEKARGYRRLVDEFGLSQEQVAAKVSKDRATVANTMRILELEEEIKSMIEDGKINFGQARALLAISSGEKRMELAKMASAHDLSVREIEKIAQGVKGARRRERRQVEKDVHVLEMESRLREVLKTKVVIRTNRRKKGVIEIEYYSLEDFERISSILLS
jgi:ParB family chromosome partitioning protein